MKKNTDSRRVAHPKDTHLAGIIRVGDFLRKSRSVSQKLTSDTRNTDSRGESPTREENTDPLRMSATRKASHRQPLFHQKLV